MLILMRGAIRISTYKKEKQVRSRGSCVDTNATCKVPYFMRISAHYEYLRHLSHCCEKISQKELSGTTRLNLSLWIKVSRGNLAFYSHGSSIYNPQKRWLKKGWKCLALRPIFPSQQTFIFHFLQRYQQHHHHHHHPTHQSPTSHLTLPHLKQTRASTLNSLHLRLTVHRPSEPLRQLIAVPELALLGLHAAQLSRSTTTNTTVGLETIRRKSLGSRAAAAAHHGAVRLSECG
jgi:hypothetical protein